MNQKHISDCIRDWAPNCGGVFNGELLNALGLQLTLDGIKKLLPGFNVFLETIGAPQYEPETYTEETHGTNITSELKELFTRHGSDKSVSHDYHLVYGEIFKKINRKSSLNILEIGLGTQNPNAASCMCSQFTVGSSIRAYKEFFPQSQIYGADIDRDTLFSEDRIQTAYVDQLQPDTFEEMHRVFGSPSYDIFIEDGLHSFVASLNSLNFALKYTKKGGVIILEDLTNTQNIWSLMTTALIARGYDARLIACKGLMLVVKL